MLAVFNIVGIPENAKTHTIMASMPSIIKYTKGRATKYTKFAIRLAIVSFFSREFLFSIKLHESDNQDSCAKQNHERYDRD